MKTEWKYIKKLEAELSNDPAIPLLGIYPKELKTGSRRAICTPMFIKALFTVAKRWKHPLSTEEIKKIWYIHKMEYYSVFKKRKSFICHINEP